MKIFGTIKDKLFGEALETPAFQAAASTSTANEADSSTEEASIPSIESEVAATLGGANAEPASMRRPDPVDIAAILDGAVQRRGQQLDWRRSIVDMMKALGMDASVQERKGLADELGYTGDKNDTVAMNIWLHRELMKALAANGGKVPAELLA